MIAIQVSKSPSKIELQFSLLSVKHHLKKSEIECCHVSFTYEQYLLPTNIKDI